MSQKSPKTPARAESVRPEREVQKRYQKELDRYHKQIENTEQHNKKSPKIARAQ